MIYILLYLLITSTIINILFALDNDNFGLVIALYIAAPIVIPYMLCRSLSIYKWPFSIKARIIFGKGVSPRTVRQNEIIGLEDKGNYISRLMKPLSDDEKKEYIQLAEYVESLN